MNWRLTFPTLEVSLHLPILRLPSGSTFITACRTKSDSELGSVSVPLHYPPAVVVCICIVWHIFLRKAIFNSSSTLLFNMHVTLTQGPQFLNTSLFKRTDGFSFTRWTLKGNFKSGWYHCLFGWIVMQVSVPLRCYSNPAWFFYPFNFLLMPRCPYNKNKRPAKRQVFCD